MSAALKALDPPASRRAWEFVASRVVSSRVSGAATQRKISQTQRALCPQSRSKRVGLFVGISRTDIQASAHDYVHETHERLMDIMCARSTSPCSTWELGLPSGWCRMVLGG